MLTSDRGRPRVTLGTDRRLPCENINVGPGVELVLDHRRVYAPGVIVLPLFRGGAPREDCVVQIVDDIESRVFRPTGGRRAEKYIVDPNLQMRRVMSFEIGHQLQN